MKNKVAALVIVFSIVFAFSAKAQTFTAKAGFNLADLKEKGGFFSPDYDMKPGFHVGLAAEFPINKFLSIEPALIYNSKGARLEETISGINVSADLNLQYLDIPVNLKVHQQMEGGLKIFATAGPYLGIGLAGKAKAKASGQGSSGSDEQKVSWGTSSEDDYKRPEFGATFGAGVEIKMVQVGISYDLGLSNIAANRDNGYSVKNRVLKFSVGYRFGRN